MQQTPDVIQLQERQPKERIIPPPKVSASSLFRFFKKADYLFESLENAALIPRFYEEGIDYLQVGQSKVAYPMVCFCDINMHLLASHVDFYGKYGLVFSKEWGCKNKIQPIHYINPDSPLRDDFSTAFCKALAQEEDSVSSNYLLSHMVYMKPLSGKMLRDGIEVDRTFSDEREWRYIPSETDRAGIPCVIPEEHLHMKETWNKAIKKRPETWLRFEPSDIRYIVIEGAYDFDATCSVISKVATTERIKNQLLSKIIIWDDIKEDF